MYYYPGHWILYQLCTFECTFSTPWGAFRPVAILQVCTCQLNHNIFRILPGPHLYLWVESSNVDKESCWRTKVPGESIAMATFTPMQGFTTFGPHCSWCRWTDKVLDEICLRSKGQHNLHTYLLHFKICHSWILIWLGLVQSIKYWQNDKIGQNAFSKIKVLLLI